MVGMVDLLSVSGSTERLLASDTCRCSSDGSTVGNGSKRVHRATHSQRPNFRNAAEFVDINHEMRIPKVRQTLLP